MADQEKSPDPSLGDTPLSDYDERGVEFALESNSPIQITGEASEAKEVVGAYIDKTLLEVDGGNINSYTEASDKLVDEIRESPINYDPDLDKSADTFYKWWELEEVLNKHDTGLLLTNFDAIPDGDRKPIAQQLKTLYESCESTIIITSTSSGSLFRANPDLQGRVRTVNLE